MKARRRPPNTPSASSRWRKQSQADHSPGAGARDSKSLEILSVRFSHRPAVVTRTDCTCANRVSMADPSADYYPMTQQCEYTMAQDRTQAQRLSGPQQI